MRQSLNSTSALARAIVALLCTLSLGSVRAADGVDSRVDGARIANADRDPGNWLTYGRTYSEQRYSPLKKISSDNANRLGLAWFADLDTNRGQEATPLVIDGVMYVSTAWSMVKAYDARSGHLLWSYDPEVPKELGVNGCCDVVSRGLAWCPWRAGGHFGAGRMRYRYAGRLTVGERMVNSEKPFL